MRGLQKASCDKGNFYRRQTRIKAFYLNKLDIHFPNFKGEIGINICWRLVLGVLSKNP